MSAEKSKELLLGWEQDAIVRKLIDKAEAALHEMYHAEPSLERFSSFQNAYGGLEEAIKNAKRI